jgi:hypothetical protein
MLCPYKDETLALLFKPGPVRGRAKARLYKESCGGGLAGFSTEEMRMGRRNCTKEQAKVGRKRGEAGSRA